MGGGGTMRGKGGGGRKMAAATVAVAALTAPGGGGGCSPRQGAAPLAAWLSSLLLAAALSLSQVSAVEVYTPAELSVENGTETKLPCSFSSSEVISSAATVTWSFQPEGSTTTVSFFYYSNGKSYPGKDTQFKDRSNWAGDLNKKDASISISNMQFRDNGTFICDVKNPPDIVVTPSEIKVRVVEKGNLPVFPITLVAGASIGGVLGLVLLIVLIVCVACRKKNSKNHYSGCSTSESLVSPVKQAPRKSPSDTEGLVNSVPIRSHQVNGIMMLWELLTWRPSVMGKVVFLLRGGRLGAKIDMIVRDGFKLDGGPRVEIPALQAVGLEDPWWGPFQLYNSMIHF
ncbi:myelin protein zero-like protein 1 isoform X1 [Zootoca vivipara]|uniref:myelin protein zero-like protein 1 isoform X1 n=1 Tax=Zootoca vivipara TaxID=8524 RepID=UPI00293B8F7B|nr:myelin protein zero-like protein 1 isoform X1 [Zootoca vivipara]